MKGKRWRGRERRDERGARRQDRIGVSVESDCERVRRELRARLRSHYALLCVKVSEGNDCGLIELKGIKERRKLGRSWRRRNFPLGKVHLGIFSHKRHWWHPHDWAHWKTDSFVEIFCHAIACFLAEQSKSIAICHDPMSEEKLIGKVSWGASAARFWKFRSSGLTQSEKFLLQLLFLYLNNLEKAYGSSSSNGSFNSFIAHHVMENSDWFSRGWGDSRRDRELNERRHKSNWSHQENHSRLYPPGIRRNFESETWSISSKNDLQVQSISS